jgi:hypothetical protein
VTSGRRSLAPGLLLIAIGLGWLLEAFDVLDLSGQVWIGLALVGIGLTIALDAGRSHGLLVALGVVLVIVGIPAAAIDADVVSGGAGDRVERPPSTAQIDDPYRLGVGQLVVDLTLLAADEKVDIEASVGMGQLLVKVPFDAAVRIDAHVSVGNISVSGADESGFDVDVQKNDGGENVFDLDLSVGVGEVSVKRAVGLTR